MVKTQFDGFGPSSSSTGAVTADSSRDNNGSGLSLPDWLNSYIIGFSLVGGVSGGVLLKSGSGVAVGAVIGGVVGYFAEDLIQTVDASNPLSKIWDIITWPFRTLVEIFTTISTTIADAITGIITSITTGISDFASGIVDAITGAIETAISKLKFWE